MYMPPHRHRLLYIAIAMYLLMDLFEQNMNKTPVLAEPHNSMLQMYQKGLDLI